MPPPPDIVFVTTPGTNQPLVTFPPDEENANLPPQVVGQQNQSESVGPAPVPFPRHSRSNAAQAMMRSDPGMGIESFKFCTVLGRGHFGKVRIFK